MTRLTSLLSNCLVVVLVLLFGVTVFGPPLLVGAATASTSWSRRRVLSIKRTSTSSSSLESAKSTLQEYIASTKPISSFYIQGWRWHTMSLIRESNRLSRAATMRQKQAQALKKDPIDNDYNDNDNLDSSSWNKAIDYVVNFNMRGLHKIENKLFLPWVAKRIQEPQPVAQALHVVLDETRRLRHTVHHLGQEMMTSDDDFQLVATNARAIALYSQELLQTTNTLIVPLIQRHVSEKDQKAFNNKVIRNLGLLDSRLHLVGMHQAVVKDEDNADANEYKTFCQVIPALPQSMIPRWKRLLYDPRVVALQQAKKEGGADDGE